MQPALTRAAAVCVFLCVTASAVALSTAADDSTPTPPIFASRYISVGDRSIPDEGASYQEAMYFDGDKGLELSNKSTPNGWYATLIVVNHTVLSDSHEYEFYPVNGVVQCASYKVTMPPTIPPNQLRGMWYNRKGTRGGVARNVFRATMGKYPLTLMTGVIDENTFVTSWMDAIALSNTADVTVHNNATIDLAVFAVPDACKNTEAIEVSGYARSNDALSMGNHRAKPSLYQYKTHADLLKRAPEAEVFTATDIELSQLPATVDHRRFATPVRNQGLCGGCWAFSSVAASEIAFNMANNITVPPRLAAAEWGSVQNILDCVNGNLNGTAWLPSRACLGGWPLTAMMRIVNHGIQKDPNYSYDAMSGAHCRQIPTPPTFPLSNAMELPVLKSKTGIAAQTKLVMAAVAKHGAVVAVINVIGAFELYGGGIFNDPQCTPGMDHAVTIVGYGSDNGEDYWLIKNSFGGNWGEGGYIRMAKGINMCGVEDFGFVPIGKVQ